MNRRTVIAALVALLAVAFGSAAFLGARHVVLARARSRMDMLAATWEDYKSAHWDRLTGRTLDRGRTTSEGQSYTLLRAVWQGDRPAFEKTWQWTRENLQHRSDHLFSWLFGRKQDGTEGVLAEVRGDTTASDADSDIALALLLAYGRWGERDHLAQAKDVIRDIWKFEVLEVRGRPYMGPDDQSRGRAFVNFNPSYLAPYSYRCFARVDRQHDWPAVVDTSYDLLDRSLSSPLGGTGSAGIPPDWVRVDRATGDLSAPADPGRTTDYGWDAIRTAWRVGLDLRWNQDPRARQLLERLSFLTRAMASDGKLHASYRHDGGVKEPYESGAAYACSLAYFDVFDRAGADSILRTKLLPLYDADKHAWKNPMTYYADNWVWFGLALHEGRLRSWIRDLPSDSDLE